MFLHTVLKKIKSIGSLGFTLTEVVIALGIGSIVVLEGNTLLKLARKNQADLTSNVEINQLSNKIVNHLNNPIACTYSFTANPVQAVNGATIKSLRNVRSVVTEIVVGNKFDDVEITAISLANVSSLSTDEKEAQLKVDFKKRGKAFTKYYSMIVVVDGTNTIKKCSAMRDQTKALGEFCPTLGGTYNKAYGNCEILNSGTFLVKDEEKLNGVISSISSYNGKLQTTLCNLYTELCARNPAHPTACTKSASYCTTLTCSGSTHSLQQCTAAGGTVLLTANGSLCRFSAASCPGGWSAPSFGNACYYSATANVVCQQSDANCLSSGAQSTGSHAWAQTQVEQVVISIYAYQTSASCGTDSKGNALSCCLLQPGSKTCTASVTRVSCL